MSVYKTISSKAVIRKIFRDLKPQNDNWIDDAVEWIGEALEHRFVLYKSSSNKRSSVSDYN